jgi:hypothetical protein
VLSEQAKVEITDNRIRIKIELKKGELLKIVEESVSELSRGSIRYRTVSGRTVMRLPPLTAMQDELPGTFLGCLKVIPTVTRALG